MIYARYADFFLLQAPEQEIILADQVQPVGVWTPHPV